MTNYRQQFDKLLELRAYRQSEIMQFEGYPRWVFWFIGTTKHKYISGLMFDLRAIEYRIEELRLILLSPNGTQNRKAPAQ